MTWISPMRTVTGQPLSARRALLGQLKRHEKKEMQLGASSLPLGCPSRRACCSASLVGRQSPRTGSCRSGDLSCTPASTAC
eukprot:241407-Chlamydomonas_euryale.AAC.1